MKEKEFYIKIQLYLKLTQFSYSDYIKNEKKFIYTKVLRKFNGLLLDHILNNPKMIYGVDFENFIELIQHLSVWIEKWDYYVKKDNPSLNDKFIFENESSFPKDFGERLIRIKFKNYDSSQRT
jgi:hypothetical protein|tara:strand:- start:1213 stop:1581 length:369 start_codon:yes stop_codon:yes gene_type:complete